MLDAKNRNSGNRALLKNISQKYFQVQYENRAYKDCFLPDQKAEESVLNAIRNQVKAEQRKSLLKDVAIFVGVVLLFAYLIV